MLQKNLILFLLFLALLFGNIYLSRKNDTLRKNILATQNEIAFKKELRTKLRSEQTASVSTLNVGELLPLISSELADFGLNVQQLQCDPEQRSVSAKFTGTYLGFLGFLDAPRISELRLVEASIKGLENNGAEIEVALTISCANSNITDE
ncbi:MAG: hypothetical protein WC838_03530 [Candidatus Margulisiibacteriota bacterium]|jgi:hypothetical protein